MEYNQDVKVEPAGWDFELTNNHLSVSFQCSICTLLSRDAVEIECKHAFCLVCLDGWEKEKIVR